MSDTTVVSAARLRAFGEQAKTCSKTITDKAHEMTAELLRTLAEWGEGTDSRNAYNDFKQKVDNCLRDMNMALAKMPPAIEEAAHAAEEAERKNASRFH
jgi:uncharacterized protein YukE